METLRALSETWVVKSKGLFAEPEGCRYDLVLFGSVFLRSVMRCYKILSLSSIQFLEKVPKINRYTTSF